jgi:molybdopterin-guanine dinucleotide biosynthesis protein A
MNSKKCIEVPWMTVAIILAGGTSQRMQEDKANMFGGVKRLQRCLQEAGLERTVVLCGGEERRSLFEGEVMVDPPGVESLHGLLLWLLNAFDEGVLLVPCDAFLLEKEAVQALLNNSPKGGVPLDEELRRQPLFAHLPKGVAVHEGGQNVREVMQHVPSIDVAPHRAAFTNFNQPADLQHPRLKRHPR